MKFSRIALLFGVFAVAAALLTTQEPSFAALNLFNKKAAPQQIPAQNNQYYINDEASFSAVAKSFHRIPFNDPQLEFDILMPKDWTSEQTIQSENTADLTLKILGDIARFRSPYIGTMQAVVTIQSAKLDREITAENWLKNYVLTNGFDIDGNVEAFNDKKANVYCVSSFEGKSNYTYLSAQINGNNIIVIRFETPIYLKEPLAFLRKRVIDSFKFILTTEQSIETVKNFNFSDVAKITYPQSWTVSNVETRDITRMSMQLYSKDQNDQINGLIRFVIIRRHGDTTLRKEADEIKKFFETFLNLEFKKLVSSDKPATTPSRFLFSRYEIYQVQPKKENALNQEVRLVTFGDKEWYIFAFVLTPPETDNFYVWACNTRAFDMIVQSLR